MPRPGLSWPHSNGDSHDSATPKHVLLTGGCGFIGHHTIEHFLQTTDWRITVLDGLTYAGDVGRLTDIDCFDPSRVSIYWHDLRAPIGPSLERRIGEVDYVINMASASHVDRSITEPVEFVLNNVQLALNVLEWARRARPKKFIQISTDEVYGPAPDGHLSREWDPIVPSNPYAASKAAQEAMAISYWRTYGVPVLITNTMNNFGERQDPEKFVPMAISRLVAGKPVPVHAERLSDGSWRAGSRVWLHARNHADALKFILESVEPAMYPAAVRPSRFNVAGDEEIDNLIMVHKIAEILDVEARYELIDFHSSRPGHDRRYALDGSALRSAGWRPPLGLDESLKRTVLWMRDRADEWLGADRGGETAPAVA